MSVGKAYFREEHLKGASLGKTLALLTYNRLGWNGLPGLNGSGVPIPESIFKKD
jgi:hypothetical protein